MDLPETKQTHTKEMAILQAIRDAVLEVTERPWLPYPRWVRCSAKKKQCSECAENPEARPHGPYIRLVKSVEPKKKFTINLGPAMIDTEAGEVLITKLDGRIISEPIHLSAELLSLINQTFPNGAVERGELTKWLKNLKLPVSRMMPKTSM